MHRATLADLSDAEVATAFNTVYSGYVLPFAVDAGWARDHLRVNDIDPAASPVRRDDAGNVAALAALGVRGEEGWIGGFGLAPDLRGRGLGRALMDDLVAAARARGLRRLRLEVLANNPVAIALYEKTGFERTRTLRLFATPDDWRAPDAADLAPATADPIRLLAHHRRFHPRPVAWQRDPAGVARLADLRGLAIGDAESPAAYLVYQATGDQPLRLWDVALPPDSAPHLWALLAALGRVHPGRPARLLNEPAESPLSVLLDELGWPEPAQQFEMVRALSRS